MKTSISVVGIHRYPVKGLSAEPLQRVALAPGKCLPHDRRFALAHTSTRFDPAQPKWLPKHRFLMLMRDEKLAELRTQFDERSGDLAIERDGQLLLKAKLTESAGREQVGAFFSTFMNDAQRGAPRVVEAEGHTFADANASSGSATGQYVSIMNLASVRALEQETGRPVDPLRFRANVHIEGVPAWKEFDWVGVSLTIGPARLRVVSRISRCAATEVNPATARRDLQIPAILEKTYGHCDMGVYAEVMKGGEIATGDTLTLESPVPA